MVEDIEEIKLQVAQTFTEEKDEWSTLTSF